MCKTTINVLIKKFFRFPGAFVSCGKSCWRRNKKVPCTILQVFVAIASACLHVPHVYANTIDRVFTGCLFLNDKTMYRPDVKLVEVSFATFSSSTVQKVNWVISNSVRLNCFNCSFDHLFDFFLNLYKCFKFILNFICTSWFSFILLVIFLHSLACNMNSLEIHLYQIIYIN